MNPYENLPDKSFWKLAVANKSMFDINELWNPKFDIKANQPVVTYGSCFAQHIGRALDSNGFNWFVPERAPITCSVSLAKKYNYGVFSSRTGNIYTTSLLKQWVSWSLNNQEIPCEVWESKGRYFDPFRPNVEPKGFVSIEDLRQSQNQVKTSFKESIVDSNYFVFTLGLTESWFNTKGGYEYPMCPGTIAGEFSGSEHRFINQNFKMVYENLLEAITLMRSVNPTLKFILTVSPVPLTATNSGKHVVTATMASKSILRAVAEQFSNEFDYVDYFPSYEIINSPVFRGAFFEPNQRSVNPYGVNFVMDNFFSCLVDRYGSESLLFSGAVGEKSVSNIKDDETCEEALLEAFGGKS